MAESTVLLVIDAQESMRHRPYWADDELDSFAHHQQALADGAIEAGIPVVQVFHVLPEGDFSIESGHVRTLEPITIEADSVFHKSRHSALVGSGLAEWLVENSKRRVIISGIRTEECCETTARHASDLGFEVDFVTEATMTFPTTDRHGRVWSPKEIKERTEMTLDHRFARIVTVDEALAST